jgi:hypothetical protein
LPGGSSGRIRTGAGWEAFARINAGEKVEKFRAVRDLIESKVKTLLKTLN